MSIAWNEFTPWAAAGGGALIGLASAGLILLCGRIAGVSGIVAGGLRGTGGERLWRVMFVAGLMLAPWVARAFVAPGPLPLNAAWWQLLGAGMLVGVGTRLGSGCTSGHGICGLSRLSRRSAVATAVFMLSAAITVFLVRHVL